MKFSIAALLITLLINPLLHAAENKNNPIKIILNNWSSQLVLSGITGKILESQGYKVEYSKLNTKGQWFAMTEGIAHVQMEIWQGTMAKKFAQVVKEGRVLDVGSHDAKTREEWWYPEYVEKLCPGLPDWKALLTCSSAFAKNERGKGVFIAGPWDKPDQARIRALGLNFTVKKVKDADGLWAALDKAAKANKAIVLFNWTPNWVEAKYAGKFVEFPDWAPECATKASWGISKKYPHDCGNPKDGWLKKGIWTGMASQWPCAYKTLQNINFSNKMLAEVAALMDVDKMPYDQAADKWINENAEVWKAWVPSSCG